MGRGQTRLACQQEVVARRARFMQGRGGLHAHLWEPQARRAAGVPAAGVPADRAAQAPHLGAQPDGDLEGPYARDHTSL